MPNFNWIDLIIVALLVGAAIQGIRAGLVEFFVVGGFFTGLFLGGWLFPHLLPIDDRTLLTLVNVNLVLLLATFAAVKGYDIGRKLLSISKSKRKIHKAESGIGMMLGVVAVLIIVWLLGAMIGRLPFEGFSNSTNDAYIVHTLDRHLPTIPAVFAKFNRLVDPNSPPQLFAAPPTSSRPHTPSDFELAAAKAAPATVRITSFGCGGLVTGSGFVVGPNLIATNAHVIAGVKRPIIKYNNHSYEGVPVLFNPNLDFAILRVKNLNVSPLQLVTENIKPGTTVAVLGYPGGNYTAVPGVMRNDLQVFGRNIYDVGVIGRNVYEIETHVAEGSSGGPVVLPDGRVAGIMFAKYDLSDNYGYALTSQHLLANVNTALHATNRVSTGVCMAG
ncbi:MAG: serine protease [Candidatus Saccharibacteria bacterium]|nr:serine protease [Candidatus Saccharibacteria bacterium]